MHKSDINIGTCSWKYDSWKGLIYPEDQAFDYLEEYSRHYNCVEIDQWFWSLFPGNKVVLPKPEVVAQYSQAVPETFSFGIKVPNSITLTHHYSKDKAAPAKRNEHFLSYDLMMEFLDRTAPLLVNRSVLMFQFEYLNKKKMAGGLDQFTDLLSQFLEKLPGEFNYCIETRNPNFLTAKYFQSLNALAAHHVFLQGYYMPSIFSLYRQHRSIIEEMAIIRMHGPDRKGIEKQTGKKWHNIVAPKDEDITSLATMISDLKRRNVHSFTFVNNHFEGSAPKSIERIMHKIENMS